MRGGVDAAADPDGGPRPRRWWDGPLDVERLAWDAVVAASFAALDHLRVEGAAVPAWAPMSGFLRAADGWVRTHANYPHHAAALTRALGAEDRPGLEAAVARRTAAEVESAVHAAGGIAVAVRSAAAWAAHPHGAATRDHPWASVAPGGPRRRLRGGRLPLEGVRVLDLTRVVAGPAAAQLAACGIADACGRDGEPGALPVQALDHATGHRLFAGIVRLMAAGRAGVVRISLLGAARTLQGLAPPPPGPAAELPVPRVQVGSEAGRLHAVPPAIALDGEVLARDVGAYGAAALRWL